MIDRTYELFAGPYGDFYPGSPISGDRRSALDTCWKQVLKAVIRGYSWTVLPITWRNWRTGSAKLRIQEMGNRYLFICSYLWLEKHLSRGDYKKEAA